MELPESRCSKKDIGGRVQSLLNIAQVAMSRSTHLFAMACHEDRVKGDGIGLQKNGGY